MKNLKKNLNHHRIPYKTTEGPLNYTPMPTIVSMDMDKQLLRCQLPGFKRSGNAIVDYMYTFEYAWTFIIHDGIIIRGLLAKKQ